MLSVSDVTPTGAKFHAEIQTLNGESIIDHGFLVLDNTSPTLANSDRISLGPVSQPALAEALCERGMTKGKEYYVRFYVLTNSITVYSNVVSFTSQGSKPPVFHNFEPALGTWGDTITITGENFSTNPSKTRVLFDNADAAVIGATSTSLKVRAPFGILNEFANISVQSTGVPGQSATVSKQFQLRPPVIDSFSATTASPGEEVKIFGRYLSSPRVLVYFNDESAPILALSTNSITCRVPGNLSAGEVEVKVFTGNGNLFAISGFEIVE